MGAVIFLIIIAWVLNIARSAKREQADRMLLLNKSLAFTDYENSLSTAMKTNLDQLVKNDYFQKARALGHSEAEIEAFWRDFSKYKNDNRFLKALGSVRAKYVR